MTESNQGPATPGTAARCEREHHLAEINRRLKERGFEPGELQAALRGLRGDQLAPFTTDEMELGLLDAFANMGGATVWCGDGSSCAVQIIEHQLRLAGLKGEPQVSAPTAPSKSVPEIERLKAENASLEKKWKACLDQLTEDDVHCIDTRLALEAENASLLESLREAEQLAESRGRMLSDSMALHEKANRDLFAADKKAAAAEQRAEAAEKRAVLARSHLEWIIGFADTVGQSGLLLNACRARDALLTGLRMDEPQVSRPKAASESVASNGAALHDEERPDVAQQVAHAEALVAQAGRSLKALEEKTGVTMHDEERSAPPPDYSEEERDKFRHGLHLCSSRCWCRTGQHFTVCTDAAQGEEE